MPRRSTARPKIHAFEALKGVRLTESPHRQGFVNGWRHDTLLGAPCSGAAFFTRHRPYNFEARRTWIHTAFYRLTLIDYALPIRGHNLISTLPGKVEHCMVTVVNFR